MESSFRRWWGVSVAPSNRLWEPKSHTEERDFSPPAPLKAGCWGLVTQAMIHVLVSSCFRSSALLLDEGRVKSTTYLWTEGRRRKEEELLTNCAMNSRQTKVVFNSYLSCPQLWLVPAEGVSKPLSLLSIALVSTLKDLFAFQIWIRSHAPREIIKPPSCRRAQKELVGKSRSVWAGLPASPQHSKHARDFHSLLNLPSVSVCSSQFRGTPCSPCAIKAQRWGTGASPSIWWTHWWLEPCWALTPQHPLPFSRRAFCHSLPSDER